MDRHITHADSSRHFSLYSGVALCVSAWGLGTGGSVASETGIQSLVEGLGLISPQLC